MAHAPCVHKSPLATLLAAPRPSRPACADAPSLDAVLHAAALLEVHPFSFSSWADRVRLDGPQQKTFKRQITRLGPGGTQLLDLMTAQGGGGAGAGDAAALAVQELTDQDSLVQAEQGTPSVEDRWAPVGLGWLATQGACRQRA